MKIVEAQRHEKSQVKKLQLKHNSCLLYCL